MLHYNCHMYIDKPIVRPRARVHMLAQLDRVPEQTQQRLAANVADAVMGSINRLQSDVATEKHMKINHEMESIKGKNGKRGKSA